MEPSKKKVKTLETLASEQVLRNINPVYHPKLLATLFENMGYREEISNTIRDCRVMLFKLTQLDCVETAVETYDDYIQCDACGKECDVDIPNVDKLTSTGSLLFVGVEGRLLSKSIAKVYKRLGVLQQFFKHVHVNL